MLLIADRPVNGLRGGEINPSQQRISQQRDRYSSLKVYLRDGYH